MPPPRLGGGGAPLAVDPELLALFLASQGRPPPTGPLGQPGLRPIQGPAAAAPVIPQRPTLQNPAAAQGAGQAALNLPAQAAAPAQAATGGGGLADILAAVSAGAAAPPQGGRLQPPSPVAPPRAAAFNPELLQKLLAALGAGAPGAGQLPSLANLIRGV